MRTNSQRNKKIMKINLTRVFTPQRLFMLLPVNFDSEVFKAHIILELIQVETTIKAANPQRSSATDP